MPSNTLVVGGGLAGTACAILLAQADSPVVLLEREASPKHKVCGEFLSAEALRMLAALGIHPEFELAPSISTVRLALANRVIESPLPFLSRSLTRRCLDTLLLDRAEQVGVDVRRGISVEALTRDTDGAWEAKLSTGGTLVASQAVLATGKHDLRGLARPQGIQGDLVALKMYFHLRPDQAAALGGSVELLLHPHGYTGLQMVEANRANLTALVRRKHLAQLSGWPGLLAELLRTNAHAATRLREATPLLERPLAISSIPYGFVRRAALAVDLWAVGDQAAVIPSFTGDGMSVALYTGIRAAQGLLSHGAARESAQTYQQTVGGMLRAQVNRATWLSRALLQEPAKQLLFSASAAWPRSLRVAASITRLPAAALQSVQLDL